MTESPQVLLVDDEATIRRVLARELEALGLGVDTAEDAAAARRLVSSKTFDCIVLDVRMPGMSGDVFLGELLKIAPHTPVIMLTAHANVDLAVRCMREGAFDLITKPCSVEHLHLTIMRALETQQLRERERTLSSFAQPVRRHARLIGTSEPMQRLRTLIERVGPTEEPVLIIGESGTGKELVAQEIYERSTRAGKPFLTVNCAAVAETLLESELFGHEKGSFSGAEERRLGFFELADGGTLFLDEIGDMPLSMQPKLLRVLQSGEFRRVGGSKSLNADVRVIAATNKDLHDEVREGTFREDLMHRINTIVIESPPLRKRPEDIDELIAFFMAEVRGSTKSHFGGDALALMRAYPWPGNVRELRNVVRRALILSDNEVFEPADLPPHILRDAAPSESPADEVDATALLSLSLAEVERRHILAVLRDCGGNKTAAARRLGISTKTLYNKFEAWGLADDEIP
ncbi:MAG: two-component system, NtrC family, response regulator HydG [Candidatus Sumerlaeota bacterium]|nr:two-component system, NtrC family, response regulator HydG [Candidatus Sumerlaeota bacterium]